VNPRPVARSPPPRVATRGRVCFVSLLSRPVSRANGQGRQRYSDATGCGSARQKGDSAGPVVDDQRCVLIWQGRSGVAILAGPVHFLGGLVRSDPRSGSIRDDHLGGAHAPCRWPRLVHPSPRGGRCARAESFDRHAIGGGRLRKKIADRGRPRPATPIGSMSIVSLRSALLKLERSDDLIFRTPALWGRRIWG